ARASAGGIFANAGGTCSWVMGGRCLSVGLTPYPYSWRGPGSSDRLGFSRGPRPTCGCCRCRSSPRASTAPPTPATPALARARRAARVVEGQHVARTVRALHPLQEQAQGLAAADVPVDGPGHAAADELVVVRLRGHPHLLGAVHDLVPELVVADLDVLGVGER